MSEKTESSQHYMFAILLFIAGLLIILIFLTIRSQAEDTNTSASITNEAPSVSSVTIAESSLGAQDNSIDLTAGSTTTIYCHAEFTDNNGCDEVDTGGNMEMIFYSANTDANCDADNDDCYIVQGESASTCAITNCGGGTDVTANVECQAEVYYHADAADWTCQLIVNDGSASSTAATATTTINSCVGLSLSGNVSFGSVALGATSTEQSLTISNTCNNIIDTNASASDLTCTIGTIDASQIKFTTTSGATYASMTAFSTSSQSIDLNIAVGSGQNDILYQMLQVPSSALSGSCTGTQTFTAAAG